jgi:uncharacterized protein
MAFGELPQSAAWRHYGARDGFEVVFMCSSSGECRFEGRSAGVQDGELWVVDYVVTLDAGWVTREAVISGRSGSAANELHLQADGTGTWRVDGSHATHLDGCLDVDLEASLLTNALPIHRLRMDVGPAVDVPAAYVRAANLAVERLEQRYARLSDAPSGERYQYEAPAFAFECQLVYDEFGLILEYPGIGVRAA